MVKSLVNMKKFNIIRVGEKRHEMVNGQPVTELVDVDISNFDGITPAKSTKLSQVVHRQHHPPRK